MAKILTVGKSTGTSTSYCVPTWTGDIGAPYMTERGPGWDGWVRSEKVCRVGVRRNGSPTDQRTLPGVEEKTPRVPTVVGRFDTVSLGVS